MSLRSDLVAYLTELLPLTPGLEDVRVIPTVRAVDEISKPILIVKTDTRSPLPQAPRKSVQGEFTLTLVSPHIDVERAEDDLEARLELLEPSLTTWGMLKFPQSDILGYLSGALNLEGGSLDGFQFRFSSLVPTDHILVVARTAADVYTLPGSPVRAEALNIANGGVDVGYYGYGGLLVNNALGIVDVAPYTP